MAMGVRGASVAKLAETQSASHDSSNQSEEPEPKRAEHSATSVFGSVFAAWPMCMMLVGGAIGGGLGGLAWGLNTAILKSNLPSPAKFVLMILSGLAAFAAYVVAVSIFFPQ